MLSGMVSKRLPECIASSALSVALVLCASACSAEKATTDPRVQTLEDDAGAQIVAGDNPRQLADSFQRDLLDSGDITFDKYQEALGRTFLCMREAGVDVIGTDVTEPRGFPEVRYSYSASSQGRSDEQTKDVADDCIYKHSFLVEQEYQTSPRALEAMDAQFRPFKDAIVDCIGKNGGKVDDPAGREELLLASYEVQADTGYDCLAESGFVQ